MIDPSVIDTDEDQVTATMQLAVLTLLEDIHAISIADVNYSRTQVTPITHTSPNQGDIGQGLVRQGLWAGCDMCCVCDGGRRI